MEIGRRQVAPYLELIQQLIAAPKTPPPPPSNWRLWPGWLRYSPDGRSAEPVDAPLEAAMCFDIEVCVRDGDHPTLAVAVTPDAWYGWCSRHLVDQTVPDGALEEDDLIKLRGSDVDLKVIFLKLEVNSVRKRCKYLAFQVSRGEILSELVVKKAK